MLNDTTPQNDPRRQKSIQALISIAKEQKNRAFLGSHLLFEAEITMLTNEGLDVQIKGNILFARDLTQCWIYSCK